MDADILIPLFGIFFVIGVPVMAIAAHFVLRPLIRDITVAIRGDREKEAESLERRLSRVEEHLLEQSRQVDQLIEAELFRRRLEGEKAPVRRVAPSKEAANDSGRDTPAPAAGAPFGSGGKPDA